jgi:ribosomal protein L17
MTPELPEGAPLETPPVGTTPEPVLTADPPKTETFDAEYVKKLRSEAAARRKEATDLAAQLKALEDEKLSATERVAKELKAAQDQIAHLTYKARFADVLEAASKAGAAKPSLVAKLIDDGADDLDAAIAAVKKENPELFRPPSAGSADGGVKAKTGASPDINAMFRNAANRNVIPG